MLNNLAEIQPANPRTGKCYRTNDPFFHQISDINTKGALSFID